MTTPTFDEAIHYAQRWTRYALDIAPDHAHPGATSHLKAADVQLTAVDALARERAAWTRRPFRGLT